jgi:hypothetical protein
MVSIGACQKATAVRLELSTNVSCDRTQGVQIFAGKPGTVDGNAPVAEDVRCTNGALGTIVAQPPEDKTATAAFRVVLGVTRPASQCTEADGLAGCIQQRRVLRYIEGETLFLPIVMYERCIGVVCDPSSTCASNGLCVSATITDSAACVPPRVCLPPGDPGTPAVPGTPTEAGADGTLIDGTADGTSPGDGSADVASDNSTFDTGTDAGADTGKDSGADTSTDAPKDAPSDSKKDVGDVPGSGEVVCGASTCVTDEACCTGKLGGWFPLLRRIGQIMLARGITRGPARLRSIVGLPAGPHVLPRQQPGPAVPRAGRRVPNRVDGLPQQCRLRGLPVRYPAGHRTRGRVAVLQPTAVALGGHAHRPWSRFRA